MELSSNNTSSNKKSKNTKTKTTDDENLLFKEGEKPSKKNKSSKKDSSLTKEESPKKRSSKKKSSDKDIITYDSLSQDTLSLKDQDECIDIEEIYESNNIFTEDLILKNNESFDLLDNKDDASSNIYDTSSNKDDTSSNKDDSLSNNDDDVSSNVDVSSEKEEYLDKDKTIEMLDSILKNLESINNIKLKNVDLTKDFLNDLLKLFKKIMKCTNQTTLNIIDFLTKENLTLLKKKDSKNKKTKKAVNKENMAINKLNPTYPEVLRFLKLDDDTPVSRAMLMQSINEYVRNEKLKNNTDILVKGNNKYFNLVGELETLFDVVKTQMIERGDLNNETEFPKSITYQDIMRYLKYFFPVKQ